MPDLGLGEAVMVVFQESWNTRPLPQLIQGTVITFLESGALQENKAILEVNAPLLDVVLLCWKVFWRI